MEAYSETDFGRAFTGGGGVIDLRVLSLEFCAGKPLHGLDGPVSQRLAGESCVEHNKLSLLISIRPSSRHTCVTSASSTQTSVMHGEVHRLPKRLPGPRRVLSSCRR